MDNYCDNIVKNKDLEKTSICRMLS